MNGIAVRRVLLGLMLSFGLVSAPWGANFDLGGATAAAQSIPSSARPGARSCSQLKGMRSLHSREPTKVTFVNKSGMYRGLMWIDFKGQMQNFGGLNSGESKVFSTFRTHPWVSVTGPGDCLKIYLPSAEPGIVLLK